MFLEDISGRSAVDFGLECTSKNFMYYVHSLRTNLQAACLVRTLLFHFNNVLYCRYQEAALLPTTFLLQYCTWRSWYEDVNLQLLNELKARRYHER